MFNQSLLNSQVSVSGGASGVSSFNTRTGAVVLSPVDIASADFVATVGGTADAITLTPTVAIASYAAAVGSVFTFKAAGTNTVNPPTINISGKGALNTTMGSVALPVGGIIINNYYNALIETASSIRVAPFDAASVNGDSFNGDITTTGNIALGGAGAGVLGTSGMYGRVVTNVDTGNPMGVELALRRADNTASIGSNLFMGKQRGTLAAPTVVVNGDTLYNEYGYGFDGIDYALSTVIQTTVDNTVSANIIPGHFSFQTANTSGTLVEAMKIDSAQIVTVTGTLTGTGVVTLSPANLGVTISPTGTGTVTLSPAGALTVNPTAASTINNCSIGATTASTGKFTTVTATSSILTTGTLNGIGYATGSGGAVTQSTSKATGVTLAKMCGTITLNGAALAADTTVIFLLTITGATMTATDQMVLSHISVGTFGAYNLNARYASATTMNIDVHNCTPGSLSEAIVIQYSVIRSVAA